MPSSCPDCAAQMPEEAAFCPGCGRSMQAVQRAQGKVGAIPENIAGALAYLTFIPAIVFLLRAPYNRNRFVRFHSFQSLLLCGAVLLLAAVLRIAMFILPMIPLIGPLFLVLAWVVAVLAAVLIWLVLIVKALQGESFELPVLGSLAVRFAGAPVDPTGDDGTGSV